MAFRDHILHFCGTGPPTTSRNRATLAGERAVLTQNSPIFRVQSFLRRLKD